MKYVAKTAAAATALAMSSTAAMAGSVGPVMVAEPVVMEEAPMGSGSGAWIIPLLAIGLIAVAISQNDDSTPAPGPAPAPVPIAQ